MAKKPAVTKSDVLSGTVFLTPEDFNKVQGESFRGLNILKLTPTQAAGPFTLTKILKNQKLGGDGKKKKPVDVYVANDKDKIEVRMPIAAGFTSRAADAKLGVGDVFAVLRGDDYTSTKYGTKKCASYEIKVISRGSGKT